MERIDWLYKLGETAVKFYLKTNYEIKTEGTLPEGPYVFLPKHQKMLDIPLEGMLIYEMTHKPANYIMRRFPGFTWLLELLGGIPIIREQDLKKRRMNKEKRKKITEKAKQKAIAGLARDEALVIHPEGTRLLGEMNNIRIKDKSILETVMSSQAYLGRIPFIPAGIQYHGRKIQVKIGQPYYTNSRQDLEEHLREEIPKLSNINHNTDKIPENKYPDQAGFL